MGTFNRKLGNINNQPEGNTMLSAEIVVKRLYQSRENENDKVAFLERHFSHAENCTHNALDEFLRYYSDSVNALLQMDYFSIAILKRLFLARNAKAQWNFSIANIINNSQIITTEQKIRIIHYEYEGGNRKILKGISRKFFCRLSEPEFEPFKELYKKHSQKRLTEIMAARNPVHAEEEQPGFSDSYLHTPPEYMINADHSIRRDDFLPRDSERDSSSTDIEIPEPEHKQMIEQETLMIVPTCAGILMAAGAIAGSIVGGPLGAVIFGAAGFVVGALIGFAICKIRKAIKNKSEKEDIPSETPRCASPASMDSDSMGTATPPGSPIFRRDSVNSEGEKPKEALSFFGWIKKKLSPEPELAV